jgi:hypothetical protein
MSPLDNDLREALRRQDPPVGFADRVLAIAYESEARRRSSVIWRWAVAAAAIVVLTAGLSIYREHLRRLEGEKVKEQVMLALRLTGSKLLEIRTHLEK